MMWMGPSIAFVAMVSSVVIAVIIGLRAANRKRLSAAPRPQLAARVAAELDALDQRFAAGQLSQADYAAERNKLLGLPPPEQR